MKGKPLRATAGLLASGVVMLAPAPALARDEAHVAVSIPAGTLDQALRVLSRQTGIAVGGTGVDLARLPTPAVEGRLTPAEALRRLLAGSPYRAVRVSSGTYRIERAPVTVREERAQPQALPDRQPPVLPQPIIVSATKRGTALGDYPGGVDVVDPGTLATARAPASLEEALSVLPQTSGTQLGAGRNKIFVRGIADSSFNGPTQSTVGLYLGEQRLGYSAPNPELPLYDMARIEVLEGPQGTLYGAGALGGVIRMVPRGPEPGRWSGEAWAGGALTEHGQPGFDGAAMANAPLGEKAALRVLGYGAREGGYITDRERGFDNVNRASLAGFRAAAKADLGSGWSATLGGFGQRRHARDGQHIYSGLPGLVRDTLVAQPFTNKLLGANLTVTGHLGALQLVSSTGIVDNRLDTRYDSSVLVGAGARQAYDEARRVRLLAHETRLVSPQDRVFAWIAGVSLLQNRDRYTQLVTSLDGSSPPPFANIRYTIDEYALFGEGALRFSPKVSFTLGGRLVGGHSDSVRLFGSNVASEGGATRLRFLPMAALSWHPSAATLVYARYQRSYRTGGVTVERATDGTPIPTKFDPDELQAAEIGLRTKLDGPVSGDLCAAAFYARWTDIQGDLIQAEGFPITRNIGNGWIAGLTAGAKLRFPGGWHADAALFLNHSSTDRLTPTQTINNRRLPNVADVNASLGAGLDMAFGAGRVLTIEGGVRYVGRSYLDIDPTSQVPQGDYADTRLAARLAGKGWSVTLALANLFDTRGNRFAFGDPFAVRLVPQATPLRPRTLRLSLSRAF